MRFNPLLSTLHHQGARAAAAAALGVMALAAAGAAQAGSNVYWSVGVAAPGVQVGVASAPPFYGVGAPVYVQPGPVYVQPAPVYAVPAPVYYRSPRVVVPAPVVYRPVVRGYGWGYGPRHHPHGSRPVPYYAPGAYGVGPAATVGYGP